MTPAAPSSRLVPLALAALAVVLALVQRPGVVVADTKVDLYVDPAGFLADVASAWTPTGQLGHVFGGQYGGYLFPMAPWFALGDLLGLPVWLVHRLWLAAILALAAWGVVRLLDALWPDRARGAAHVGAAVLYLVNPYVAVYANRTSVALLAYAALPWLLVAVHHGLRAPRSWRWPALFALVLTCTGGGVNAATTAWILLGPLLLVAYERFAGGVGRGALLPFALRLAPAVAVANVWWVVPVLVHARFGLDFLPFTEQPGTIWQTTSVTESLRLVGFWTSYIGVGFGGELRPFAGHGGVLLFHPPVLVASLLVPGLVLLAFAWTRRWRYAPWWLLLTLVGLVVMVAGWPEGTPLRRALTFTYNHLQPVQFLRTTYKAGPLVSLGLACLGGAAFALAWQRRRLLAALPALGLVAVAAWPLTTGRAPERRLAFDVPAWWHAAARHVDRLPSDERALVLPGQHFAFYDWGGTIDPILPSLSRRPVAQRTLVPYADLRAIDLLWAVDDLVTQERALPGQLPALLDLLGAGAVVTAADGDRSRSGEVGPVEAADALAVGRGPAAPRARALGPPRLEQAAAGRVRAPQALPRVRVARSRTGGLVRLVARDGATVVDGGGQGVAALAGFGGLEPSRPLVYAADAGPDAIRRAAEVVVTDTNRRQAFVAARPRANRGAVLAPDEDVSEDGTMLDPFDVGADAQTVARRTGVRSVRAPFSPQVTQFPEHRPFAAVDGDPATAWLADRALARDRHWVEVRLRRRRAVGHVDVLPYSDERGRVTRLAVNGREAATGRGGWVRVALGGEVDRVRVTVLDVSQPAGVSGGAGGIAELRIPGVRARETLRPPVLAERALRAGRRGGGPALSYLLARTTTDAPLRRGPPTGPFQSYLPRDRVDPEPQLARTIAPPAPRAWAAEAWTSVDPSTPEPDIDRLAGVSGSVTASSSGPYEGLPGLRASKAFDGRPRTAWIGAWAGRASLRWALRRPVTVRRLRLVAPEAAVRRPTRVRLRGGEGPPSPSLTVGPRGTVALPRPVRARRFLLEVLDARFAPGTPGRARQRRAVGVAEVAGVPGARLGGGAMRLRGRCGDARLRTSRGTVALRAEDEVAALDGGHPIAATACGPPRPLPAGRQEIAGSAARLRVDHLRLRTAPARGVADATPAGRVVDPGRPGRGRREGVVLDVDRPAWLVLGEGFNRGWRATCDGEDLGPSRPVQGHANGWPVGPGCRAVELAFAPNRLLVPGYLVSLLACLVLLAVLVGGRSAAPTAHVASPPLPDGDPPARWPLRRAIAAGALAAAVLGFVFALRAGVVIGPAVAVVLWRGIGARALALAGGALLVTVVPLLYLAVPVDDPGGYNTNVAVERVAAHWVGVAAVCLLGAALVRQLSTARARAAAAAR